MIELYLQYFNIEWAINKTTSLDTLFKMQKKVIRLITRNKLNSRTATLFKNSNILTCFRLFDINRLQVGCFVYQAFLSHLPEYFNSYFVTNQSIHGHLTSHIMICISVYVILMLEHHL